MGLLLWILFGALVGWLTTILVGADSRFGLAGNLVLGVLGALVGGFVSSLMGLPGITGFNLYSALIATFGALIVVGVARLARLS